jgi:archaellum component FlaC
VDDSNIPSIAVEQPDWKVGVEVPSEIVKVTVDVTNAASSLERAVAAALANANIRVENTGGPNAVGGEALNELSRAVKSVSDRIITINTELNNKINMLGSNKETVDINRMVNTVVENNIATLRQDVNNVRNDVARVESSQRQATVTWDARLGQLEYRLNSVANFTGTNGIGGR